MNSKYLYLLSGLSMISFSALALPLSPEEAVARLHYYDRSDARRMVSSPSTGIEYLSALNAEESDTPAIYVCRDSRGQILYLGADTRLSPLLAIVPEPVSDAGMPESMRWMLDSYRREAAYVYANIPDREGMISAAVDESEGIYTVIDAERGSIEPLVSTKWDQSFPYNKMCPAAGNATCVTGCVATSMAQVLAYHKWPECGRGYFQYPTMPDVKFDFDNTPFDWENMLDVYSGEESAEQEDAVATLMLACGVGVRMIYSSSVSAAYPMLTSNTLREYFRYSSSVMYKVRDVYSPLEWERMIYGELAEGRPVIYGGHGPMGGHSFVCDGYLSDGLFHINWGWSGRYDGYFRLSALSPEDVGIGGGSGNFNSDQDAVIGITPDYEAVGGDPLQSLYATDGISFEPSYSNRYGRITLTFRINGGGGIANPAGDPVEGHMGVMLAGTGSDPIVMEGQRLDFTALNTNGTLPSFSRFTCTIDCNNLTPGEYRMYPMYRQLGGRWERVRIANPAEQYVTLRVGEDGYHRVFASEKQWLPDIDILMLKAPGSVMEKDDFSAEISFINADEKYDGMLYLTATPFDKAGDITAEWVLGSSKVELPFGKTDVSLEAEAAPDPGEYLLTVRDDLWRPLGPATRLTVKRDDHSGVLSTEQDGRDIRYYSIEGMRISGPGKQKGVYIKEEGGIRTRIFVK